MLTAVKCAGRMRCRMRTPGPFNSGNTDTVIGISRMALSPTPIATSIKAPPPPSADTRMTCAGAAQIKTVDRTAQSTPKPRSCASAPKPT